MPRSTRSSTPATTLAELPGRLAEIPPQRPVVVYCAGGYRSSVAASLLRRAGRRDVFDLLGGYAAGAQAQSGEPHDLAVANDFRPATT